MKHGAHLSLNRLRKSRAFRLVCAVVALETLFGQFGGHYLYALTSGPDQPEASSFTPADISNLVDPFSGDFSYNVPLMEIGGYPINLAYSGGSTMDQEATWAGLGWNVNTGSIVRDVRGLPDDFMGDEVERKWNMNPNITVGAGVDLSFEAVGFPFGQLSAGAQMSYNNYSGISVTTSLSPGVAISRGSKSKLNVGLGMSAGGDGLSISPNVSLSSKISENGRKSNMLGLNIGLPINSRAGAQGLSFGASFTQSAPLRKYDKKQKELVDLNKNGSTSKSIGTMISFGGPTHTPTIEIPFSTFSFTGKFSMGAGVYGGDADIALTGFFTEQSPRGEGKKFPAFGYNFLEVGQARNNAMLDFNREKDGSFSMSTPNLPQTSLTYDVYNIMAQGIGGSFRPFRNEVGYVFDPEAISISNSGNLGVELSGGQVVNIGGEFEISNVTTRAKAWLEGNTASRRLKFKWPYIDDLRENWHFRLSNEMAVNRDDQFVHRYGGYGAERPINHQNASELRPLTKSRFNRTKALPLDNTKQSREIRTTAVLYHTVGEVRKYFPHNAKYLKPNSPAHHIAQITIITGEGKVYVFGLPAYNTSKKEITMAVGNMNGAPLQISGDGSYVSINSSMASPDNDRGLDHYYDETSTPAYVHTWFLTEVYSADYSDITGNGPSEDDLGNYTLFSYGVPNPLDTTRRLPDIPSYFWKTPMSSGSSVANYMEGMKSVPWDDKGSLVYGTKDVWYLKTIESKTQVVSFELSDREDGYGGTAPFSSAGGSALKKIDRIHLYAKEDYLANAGNATPIKTVHFKYNYALCDGVPNNLNGGGKLTLKEVYFTFEKSGRSKFSPYKFDYGENDPVKNPDYAAGRNDRWGNYKVAHSGISNVDFSYTHQDRSVQDDYASAWCLRDIITPSGGKISVEYESDAYAYVQDRQASKMFRLVGAGNSSDVSLASNQLFQAGSHNANAFLFFALDEHIDQTVYSGTQANAKVIQEYIKGWHNDFNGPKKHLYFRVLVNVAADVGKKEYVSGYAEIETNPITGDVWAGATRNGGSGPYTHGYVRVKLVPLNDSGTPDTQPISKAAWQFSRIQTPRYAYNQPDPSASAPEQLLKALGNANLLAQVFEFFQGPNRAMRNKGFGHEFSPSESFIRLYVPDGEKLGGGVRVKSVKINDSWASMTPTESSYDYGQTYEYTLEDGRSSGVASWEPALGADENPHRYPIFFSQSKNLVPDDRFYQETPLCEGLFPSPSVGYSRVVVKNLDRTGVSINATGYTEHQFYTARDFPTKYEATEMKPHRNQPPFILSLLNVYSYDYMSAAQGFYIELNDMHGKPKATRVFAEGQTVPLQETKHYYNLTSSGGLSSRVPILRSDGSLDQQELGVDVDMVFDFREHSTESNAVNVPLNLAFFLVGVFPAFVPTAVPTYSGEETRFRSATFTKVVRRTGIEMKTEQVDLGSRVLTENKAFDPQSGTVLVTQVNNEYEDDRYALNVPAYWAYPGMGHATQNWGVVLNTHSSGGGLQINSNGELTGTLAQHLFPGDVVTRPIPSRAGILKFLHGGNFHVAHANRWWVSVNSSGNKVFIDASGNLITPNSFNAPISGYVKVLKAGRQNLLQAQAEQLEMLEQPFRGDSLVLDQASRMLSASAIEYDQRWKMFDNRLYYSQDSLVLDCRFQTGFSAFLELLNRLIRDDQMDSLWVDSINVSQLYPGFSDTVNAYGPNCGELYLTMDTLYNGVGGVKIESFDSLGVSCGDSSLGRQYCIFGINISQGVGYAPVDTSTWNSISYFDTTGIITQYYPNTDPLVTQYSHFVTAYLDNGSPVSLHFGQDFCFDVQSGCDTVHTIYPCNFDLGQKINPYIYNVRGKHRAFRNYTYLTPRSPGNLSTAANLRTDGYFAQFAGNIWTVPLTGSAGLWLKNASVIAQDKWKWASEITNYSPHGTEIENMDALGNYSTAIYGYKHTLPIAVSKNARYRQIAYDGFEDYYNNYFPSSCEEYYFRFNNFSSQLSTTEAHTGLRSMEVPAGDTVFVEKQMANYYNRRTTDAAPYLLQNEDLLGFFSPEITGSDQKYLVSFWVKQSGFNPLVKSYTGIQPMVELNGTPYTLSIDRGPIIDGWQQMRAEFTILANSSGTISFGVRNTTGDLYYFDDYRVHPFQATMQSFVYHPGNFRYMAQLDENNYATFYEYDEEGNLIRIKKETVRGVMTIQENRQKSFRYDLTNP